MSSPDVLITGATGFIGFKVLLRALAAGYSVRAAVRNQDKAQYISSHPKITALGVAERLSFVFVGDICSEDAYRTAVQGVSYIMHLASPLPSPALDPQTGIYEPSVNSVKAILNAAHAEASVKKVIITTSVFANTPFPPPGPDKPITPSSRVPDIAGPFNNMIMAYGAGKVAAINATDRFVAEMMPRFSVVNIFPGFCFGRDDRAVESAEELYAGSNRLLLGLITGIQAPAPLPSGFSSVEDVVQVEMLALQGANKTNNLGVTKAHVFDDAWCIAEQSFPKAVAAGVLKQGSLATITVDWDASQTEKELEIKYKSYGDVVIDVARQYLELAGHEAA